MFKFKLLPTKTGNYLHRGLHVHLMVTPKKILIVNTQNKRRKKYNAKERQQNTREERKRNREATKTDRTQLKWQ